MNACISRIDQLRPGVAAILFLTAVTMAMGQAPDTAQIQVTATPGSDGKGCFVDITYTDKWKPDMSTSALQFPYGIEVMISSATITAVENQGGAWLASAQTVTEMQPAAFPTPDVRFTRRPIGPPWTPADSGNIARWIPPGQKQSFRIRINRSGNDPVKLWVFGLNGLFVRMPDDWDTPRAFGREFTFEASSMQQCQ